MDRNDGRKNRYHPDAAGEKWMLPRPPSPLTYDPDHPAAGCCRWHPGTVRKRRDTQPDIALAASSERPVFHKPARSTESHQVNRLQLP
jgi:hypothetical protein